MLLLLLPNGGGLWILVMLAIFSVSNRQIAMRIVMVFKKILPYLFMANSVVTAILTGLTIHENQQLYPTLKFLTHSQLALIVYQVQCILSMFMLAILLTKFFFVRLYESEWNDFFVYLSEELTEAVFVLTIFRRSINPSAFFTVLILLIFLKTFHWLVAKRIDTFERNSTADVSSHLRIVFLWILLLLIDIMLLNISAGEPEKAVNAISVTIFFEVIVMTISLVKAIFTHFLVLAEIFDVGEGNDFLLKTVVLLLFTVLIDILKVMVYSLYFYNMLNENVVPLFLAHSIAFVVIDFGNDLKSVMLGYEAIRYMRNCPNAQPEELRNSNLCVICRDEMTDTAKKLPCGHIFHKICLIFWYMRQQTCPVCRFNIRENIFQINLNTIFNRRQQAQANNRPQAAPAPTTHNAPTVPAGTAANNINGTNPMPVQNIPMTYFYGFVPFINPYSYYVPQSSTIPMNLENYTDEQLEALEKTMRANVALKFSLMAQTRAQLNAADQLMTVYNASLTRTESAQQGETQSNGNSTI